MIPGERKRHFVCVKTKGVSHTIPSVLRHKHFVGLYVNKYNRVVVEVEGRITDLGNTHREFRPQSVLVHYHCRCFVEER